MSEEVVKEEEIKARDPAETSLSNTTDPALPPKPAKKKPSISDYTTIKCLGTGSFGEVVLAKSLLDKKKYAIKILSKAHMEKTNSQKNAIAEREFLCLCKCRQVPKLATCFQDIGSLYFVMEYCNGGTLKEYLFQNKSLSTAEIKKIIAEIVLILEAIRKFGVCHRDLKPENLVFDSDGHLKLIDFGTAKLFEKTELNEKEFDRIRMTLMEYEKKFLMTQNLDIIEDENEMDTADTEPKEFVGTAMFAAPETLINGYSDFEVDYWSLGIMLYGMVFNRHPFEDETSSQYNMCKRICAGQFDFPQTMPPADPQAIDLIKRLLTRDPKKRLGCGKDGMDGPSSNGFDKLKYHDFLKDVDYSTIYNEKGLKVMKTLASKTSVGESQVMTEGSSFNSTQGNLTAHSRRSTIEILAKVDTKRKKFLLIEVSGCLILLSDGTIRYDQTYDNSSRLFKIKKLGKAEFYPKTLGIYLENKSTGKTYDLKVTSGVEDYAKFEKSFNTLRLETARKNMSVGG